MANGFVNGNLLFFGDPHRCIIELIVAVTNTVRPD